MTPSLAAGARAFLDWWIAELKGLMPEALRSGVRRNRRRLVLSVEGSKLTALMERGPHCTVLKPAASESADGDAALDALAEAARARPGTPLGIRLAAGDCFSRILYLPARAERDFGAILALDLEHGTPFRRDEVLTAHCIDEAAPAEPGKRAVRQVIVKRPRIESVMERMAGFGLSPGFIDCWNEARSAALPIDLLAAQSGGPSRLVSRLTPYLAALLVVSALSIFIVRHQSALEALDARIAETRNAAESVRRALETAQADASRFEALERLSRERVSALRVVDELSAMLPDTAWVYDLRLDGGLVELTGFARSAAGLIPLFERSPTFATPALTAPVVFEASEDRERFSLRTTLRGAPASDAGSAANGPTDGSAQ